MTPRRSLVPLVCLVLLCGCVTAGGMRRIALATEQVAHTLEALQLSADALEQGGVLTKAQRDSLSPSILALARADQALANAVAAGDRARAGSQLLAMLEVLVSFARDLTPLPVEARARLQVAVDALRAALIVIAQAEGMVVP